MKIIRYTVHDNDDQEPSEIKTENRELRNIIAAVKHDNQNMQENMQIIRDTVHDNDQELSMKHHCLK